MKRITILLLSFTTLQQGYAQMNDPIFEPSIPPSPTVAQLWKFTDIPVDLSTGTPNISIPIYEINTGLLKVPISLNYHASGIKVNEEAGNVGLGWSLQAEGVITQVPLGLKDNGSYQGNQNNCLNWTPKAFDKNVQAELDILKGMSNVGPDGVPDLYYYSFPGNSGKFIFADRLRLLQQKNIDIQRVSTGISDDWEWTVTGEDGTKYYFSAKETAISRTSSSIAKSSISWYLTKIVSANGNDEIKFHYNPPGHNTLYFAESGKTYATKFWDNYSSTPINYNHPGTLTGYNSTVTGQQLYKIEFNNGSVEYDISWNNRLDHGTGTNYQVPRVDKIIVKNKQGLIVKVAHLTYSYYQTANPTSTNDYRLRLDKVTVNASLSTGTASDQVYRLNYNAITLPSQTSLAMDHWGYYNGANSNTTLIPSMNFPSVTYTGANRDPNPATMKAGILEKITYPTGGWSEFEFEPHTAGYIAAAYTDYADSLVEVHYTNDVGDASVSNLIDGGSPVVIPSSFQAGLPATFSGSLANYPSGQTQAWYNHNYANVKLYKIDNNGNGVLMYTGVLDNNNSSYSKTLTLQPGSYYIQANTNGPSYEMRAGLKVTFHHTVPSTPQESIVGGLRIKKITNHDPYTNKDEVKQYEYKYTNANGVQVGSGQLFKAPTYEYRIHKFQPIPGQGGQDPEGGSVPLCMDDVFHGFYLSSNSTSNLGAGNHMRYINVREILGANREGGYTEYSFLGFSGAGEMDLSSSTGLLISKKEYNANNVLQREIQNTYKTSPADYRLFAGAEVVLIDKHSCSGTAAYMNAYPMYFRQNIYAIPTEWVYTDQTVEKEYLLGGTITNTTNYFYDNAQHKQLSRIYQTTSDGRELRQHFLYPKDLTLPSSSANQDVAALIQLKDLHIDNAPVEQTVRLFDPATSTHTTKGSLREYRKINTSQVIPSTKYELSLTAPLSSYQQSSIAPSGVFAKDGHYQPEHTLVNVDSRENPTELNKEHGERVSMVWMYNKEYMTARCVNAAEADMAYSGFEVHDRFNAPYQNETGNWTYSNTGICQSHITGHYAFDLATGGTIGKTNIGAGSGHPGVYFGDFIVSYWKKVGGTSTVTVTGSGGSTVTALTGNTITGDPGNNNGQWIYCEHKVLGTSSVQISGNAIIDELRLYPATAQMETYTYNPLVGITSKCDVANLITFYDYDDLGRLIHIRDQYGKIIQKTEYATQRPE